MAADDFDFRRTRRVLERIPREMDRHLRGALKLGGSAMQEAMHARFTGYSNPRTAGDLLQNRSGEGGLRSAITHDVAGQFGTGQPLTLRAFVAGKPYARLQEFGGTITPKRGRFLTIPIADNLTTGGRVRYPSAADLERTYPGQTYFARSKRGSLLLFAKGKPGAAPPKRGKPKTQLLFVLKERVTVPPRLGFRETWRKLAPKRVALIRSGVDNALRAARGGF